MLGYSRAVLVSLEESPKTIDQLSVSTGIDKKKLAHTLDDLRRLGWVSVAATLRKSRWHVHIYGLIRRLPPAARVLAPQRYAPPDNVAGLLAVFGINAPRSKPRGRRIRVLR